jgi:iron complex outermembrane receptor protein
MVTPAVMGSIHVEASCAQEIDEIVITAQKREQSLQDVGISVLALSAEQLDQLGIDNATDIAQQIPALRLSAWTPAFTIFSLRGVSQNNFQDNLEAPVAVYMDGVYMASMNAAIAQLFDMERVEVLRGPQGTLFGRNATDGLLQFLSRCPTDDEFNGYVEISTGSFGSCAMEAALGGALSDRTRARIAARHSRLEGYVKAGTASGVPVTGQTSQGADGVAVRGRLQVDVTDAVTLDLTVSHSSDTDVPTGQCVVSLAGFDINKGLGTFNDGYVNDPNQPAPVGPQDFSRTPITGNVRRHASNADAFFDREITSATAQVTAEINELELVSITSWNMLDKFYIEDAAGGLGFFPYTTTVDFDQWSQELRLSGGESRTRWQVGASFLDMASYTSQRVEGALYLGGTSDSQKLTTHGRIDSRNWSVFGQAEFDLTDRFNLISGLRWSDERKSLALFRIYEDLPKGVAPVQTFDLQSVGVPGIGQIDYEAYAARLQLNFRPKETALWYLSFNRGIKSGNWSLDPAGAVAPANLKHREEVLHALEMGLKTELWNGAARLNASIFSYDYDDYQAFSLVGLTPQVANSDARASGGELQLTLAPTKSLTLIAGLALLDSRVDAVPDVFGGSIRAEFPLAPAVSANLLARYEWEVGSYGVAAQVDGQWNDRQFPDGTNSDVSVEPAYSVWNARLSFFAADQSIQADVVVKNLFDEEYRLHNLDLGLLGFVEQVFAPPRQSGTSLTITVVTK